MSLWVRAWVLLGLGVVNLIAERQIFIGGLFDDSPQSNILKIAFDAAISKVNNNSALLPERELVGLPEYTYKDDSYSASQRVCMMVKSGVVAIFGPQSETTASHVQSMCDVFEIPHIETRWDYRFIREEYSVNVHPYPPALASIYVKLIEKFDWWVKFCIVYQDDSGLVRVQELLKMAKRGVEVKVYQLSHDHNHRGVFNNIMLNDIHQIIIDCDIDILYEVLKQAQQVGIVTSEYEYFITNLDFQTLDLEDFKYSGANITGFGLIDYNRTEVKTITKEWTYDELQKSSLKDPSEKTDADRQKEASLMQLHRGIIPTEAGLMYDAVILFATALTNLDRRGIIEAQSLPCNGTTFWSHGISIKNYIKHEQLHNKTMTGFLGFNNANGFRELFELDLLSLTPEGLEKVGKWHKAPGTDQYAMHIKDPHPDKASKNSTQTKRHFRVATKEGSPYFMKRKHFDALKGNEQYEGYVVDLVTELSKLLNFTFDIYAAPFNAYGSKLPNGTWDGMIGEVIYNRSDMGLADLTITTQRQEVVDFTTPFINLGISILYKKPQKEPPALFSFLDPFSIEVWLYMSAAYIGVSLILFVLARFSPYEWDNPYPCIQDPEELENNFTLLNSLWFTIGSLMQQGSDIAPKAVSTRIVAGMWWFFTLIIISSYTANLAAFLTVETMAATIESAADLARQTKIKYGCLKKGSTNTFFQNATLEPYITMWKYMEKNPGVFMNNNEEGMKRVMNENYAFFMESSSIEYVVKQECGLRRVGGLLDTKGYGIAVRKGSELRMELTDAILSLQEKEFLDKIKKTWWEKGGKSCTEDQADQSPTGLTLSNVGGVFVVLLSGMGFACIVALIEFMWNIRNTVKENRGSLCAEMLNELKFVVRCYGSTKPVRKNVAEPDNQLLNLRGYNGLDSHDT